MAPDYPPSLIVLDLRTEECGLRATVEYLEFSNEKRLRFRWNALTKSPGFLPVGNGVAFVEEDSDLIFPPKNLNAIPDDLGHSRYRWTEGLRQSSPWAILILVLPPGFTLHSPSPAIASAKEFGNRIAVYWALRGDQDGHTEIEWTLSGIDSADTSIEVQKLLQSSSISVQNPQIVQIDAGAPKGTAGPNESRNLHPLDEEGTPNLLQNVRWFQRNWRKKWIYALGLLLVLGVVWLVTPKLSRLRTSLMASESLSATISDLGFAPADSSLFVDLTFRNDGDANATIINSFLAVSDSSSLHLGWRGATNLYANGPLEFNLAPGESRTKRIYYYHSISPTLKRHYGSGILLVLSIHFVSLDKSGGQHWSKHKLGSLFLIEFTETPGLSKLLDVIRIQLLPTDRKLPFPAGPPFEHGGLTWPATTIPPSTQDQVPASVDSISR